MWGWGLAYELGFSAGCGCGLVSGGQLRVEVGAGVGLCWGGGLSSEGVRRDPLCRIHIFTPCSPCLPGS